MNEQDIFVGLVAVCTGLFIVASVIVDAAWFNRFWLSRRVANISNHTVSRVVVGAIGALCAVLGVLLILGFFSGESRKSKNLESPGDRSDSQCGLLMISELA
ncbi:MAG: hypothetical protein ACR2NP_08295 [Pirellulaceae bacterium]